MTNGLISGTPPIIPGSSSHVSYPVTVTVDDGNGGTAETLFVISVLPQPPVARSSFQAEGKLLSAAGAPYVYLTWLNPNPETAKTYTIERMVSPGLWSLVVNAAPVSWGNGERAFFEDHNPQIVEGGAYQYRLSANNDGGPSPWVSPVPNPVIVPVALRVFKPDRTTPGIEVGGLPGGLLFRWVTNLASSARIDIKRNGSIVATGTSESSDGGFTHRSTINGLASNTQYDFVATVKSAPSCVDIDCVIVQGTATTGSSSNIGLSLVLRVDHVTISRHAQNLRSGAFAVRVDVDTVLINTGGSRIDAPIALNGARLRLPCPIDYQADCGDSFATYPRSTGDVRQQTAIAPTSIGPLDPAQVSPRVTLTFYIDEFIFSGNNGRNPPPIWGNVGLTANYNTANGPLEEQPSSDMNLVGTGTDLRLFITPRGSPVQSMDVELDNPGFPDIPDVTMSIQLPAGYTAGPVDFGPSSQCRVAQANRILCDFSPLTGIGIVRHISLTPGQPSSPGIIWGFASSASVPDPNLANNLAVASLGSGQSTSLRVEGLSATRDLHPPRREASFAFRVVNDGMAIAHGLTVRAEGDNATITRLCIASCTSWNGASRALNIDLPPGVLPITVTANVQQHDTGRVVLGVGSIDPETAVPGYENNTNQLSVFPVQ
jgi:hypothetical protein